jgi:small subunit ribosomal protein S2
MLTNFATVKMSIQKLKRIEKMKLDGTYESLTKKEVSLKERLREKLERSLGGIKNMNGIPSVVFVIDSRKECTVIAEARRLGIPVVAVTDTNSDPSGIDFVIPGNDDSLKAIQLYASRVADACLAGKQRRHADAPRSEEGTISTDGGRTQVKVKRLKNRDEDTQE